MHNMPDNACPHGFLLASASELSGNPFGNFIVYSIYATYGGICALRAYAEMAEVCGRLQQAQRYTALAQKFAESMLEKLVSKGPQHTGQDTRTPQGGRTCFHRLRCCRMTPISIPNV